jgi:histidinol-phosphate aminotransferase
MLLIQAYAAFTGSVLVATPGYSLYSLCATRLGSARHEVPLVDWKHDLDGMARVECDIAFICNPHNPSGTVVDAADLNSFIENSAARLIVIDEAYIDFSTEPRFDTVAVAVRDPRVVVLRTFSKAHALAGLRVGYLIAHRDIASILDSLRLPFSVNSVAQALARRSLDRPDDTARAIEAIVANRDRVEEILTECGFEYVPSQGNFVLVLTEQSDRVVQHLASLGIAVRPGRDVGVENAVRLTIPSADGLPALEQAVQHFTGTALTS